MAKKRLTSDERTAIGSQGTELRDVVTQDLFGQYKPLFKDVYYNVLKQPVPEETQEQLDYFRSRGGGTSERERQEMGIDTQTRSAIQNLSGEYIKIYTDKTGTLPTQEQVTQFVKDNINKDVAARAFTGNLMNVTPGIKSYVQNQLEEIELEKEEEPQPTAISQGTSPEMQKRLDDLFGRVQEQAISSTLGRIREETAPERKRLIEEEATLGRLRSPVSAATLQGFDTAVESDKAKAVANIFGQLAQQKIGGELGIYELSQGMEERERRAKEAAKQFRQELGLRRRGLEMGAQESALDRIIRGITPTGGATAAQPQPSGFDTNLSRAALAAQIASALFSKQGVGLGRSS